MVIQWNESASNAGKSFRCENPMLNEEAGYFAQRNAGVSGYLQISVVKTVMDGKAVK